MHIQVGFYKGKGTFFDFLVRIFTFSKFSHCAIITRKEKNYMCGFTALPFRGVDYFEQFYDENEWEFFDTNTSNANLIDFYYKTKDCKYDYCGCINCIIKFHQHKNRYFCSEWCAEFLKLDKPETYTPQKLYEHFSISKQV